MLRALAPRRAVLSHVEEMDRLSHDELVAARRGRRLGAGLRRMLLELVGRMPGARRATAGMRAGATTIAAA